MVIRPVIYEILSSGTIIPPIYLKACAKTGSWKSRCFEWLSKYEHSKRKEIDFHANNTPVRYLLRGPYTRGLYS